LDLARTANQPVAITMKKFMRQFRTHMHPILKRLTGGARRSIGRSNQVVAQVLAHPNLFPHLFDGLASGDEVLRMRAADALEKITTRRPKLLQPFKKKFLAIASSAIQQEVRWHAALLIPRLDLTPTEGAAALDISLRLPPRQKQHRENFRHAGLGHPRGPRPQPQIPNPPPPRRTHPNRHSSHARPRPQTPPQSVNPAENNRMSANHLLLVTEVALVAATFRWAD
jgi:hypothetical protein